MGKQSRKIKAELISFVGLVAIRISTRLTLQLYIDTPKDTGFAESNWIPQIGTTFSGTAGTRENAERGIINRSYQIGGISKINSSYNIKMGVINITNNVDYIEDLNDGSSNKAPKAFTQIAILKTIKGID